jgi:transposase
MISAVGPRGDFRFMIHEGTVDSDVFITFLERLLIGSDQPVFLVVDGHAVHKSAAVKRFVADRRAAQHSETARFGSEFLQAA